MQLRVLGPVEAVGAEGPLSLGGPKQRTVLALLAQAVDRRVAIDELILGVYGEEAAAGARRTVQTYVSNLRHVLGESVRRSGNGYVLDGESVEVDARRFESQYRSALIEVAHEPQRAALRLRDTLALWRGHAYADVEAHGALDAEIARLHEMRLSAIEHRIGCELELGQHVELVGELEALTAEHPFRESLRAHQVVALYRSGRQSDALAALGQSRRLLGEELGIDPSVQLQQLERQILVHDAALGLDAGPRVERRAVLVAELDAESWSAGQRAAALARRDQVLAEAVERAEAVIVGLRGTAVFVTFAEVSVGVSTAVALAGLESDTSLRLALDHGAVEVRDEMVTGPPINRVARIVALAHPGQVLLSPDAHQALAVDGSPGWSATALGRHAVTGVDEPLALYQLQGVGLPNRFPSLRSERLPPPVPRSTPASPPGYELRTELGSDETSVVYRAYQASVGREVVVRAISREFASRAAFIRRFEAEGQRVGRLSPPHALALLDHWRDPEGAYLVHAFVQGSDLRGWLASHDLSFDERLQWLEQIAATLAYAHTRGVVHGRLHPGNLLVDEVGGLYVTDLGVAQMMSEGLMGSNAPAYAAPETLGAGPATVAADVYALGVMSFELLEGRPPPHDSALPLPAGAVGQVMGRATSPDPADRYDEVGTFLAELRVAVRGPVTPRPRPLTAVRNPYRGLEPFREADAPDFHGRDSLIDEMITVFARQQLLTVVGPSGIGKSSVVRAGLLPALRVGAVEGSRRWLVSDLFPGSRPFAELAAALRRVAIESAGDLTNELRAAQADLSGFLEQLLPAGTVLLLVIDQFEELFTQTSDEGTTRAFLDLLVTGIRDPNARLRVVVTMRADFLDRPLRHASFAELMRPGLVTVPAPTRDELARCVRAPANGVGVAVEERLVERIVSDADGEPGALPLLQYVLAERFTARGSDELTLDAYDASGGLRGAIGRRAEALYLGLDGGRRSLVRELFLRLVTVDEDAEDTRHRVRMSELSRLGSDRGDLDGILDVFGSARLLTFDRDPVAHGPTVEVAHEALLTQWDRLADWIDAVRDDLLTRRRISSSVREWEEASRDPSFLLRGARLEAAEAWRRSNSVPLTEAEDAYVTTSRRTAEHEAARRRRRRRRTFAGLSGALVATLVFSVVAVNQRAVAEEQERLTRARQLGGEALVAVDADPERGILLALEALDTYRDDEGRPVAEAASALHSALQASRVELHLPDGFLALAISPDGGLLATDSVHDPTRIEVTDAATGGEVISLVASNPVGEAGIAFSPDGEVVAVSYDSTDGGPAVETFDTGSWRSVDAYLAPPDSYTRLQFTDDGEHLVANATNGVVVWEVGSEAPSTTLDPVQGLAVVPDSALVAVTRGDEKVEFVDVRDGETMETLDTPGFRGEHLAVDAGGERVATHSFTSRAVEVWDRGTGERLARYDNPSPLDLVWAPDGRLVHTANDGTIRLVTVGDHGEELVLRGHGDGVTFARISHDGEMLASVGWAGETRTWDITREGPADLGNVALPDGLVAELVPSGDGERLAASIHGDDEAIGIELFDPRAGSHTLVEDLRGPGNHWVRIADDLSAAAGLDADYVAHVYDLPAGESRLTLPPCQSPRAISADGSQLVVDGRLLCINESGGYAHAPPSDAEQRSAVIDAHTGEVLLDLDERPINWAAFGPPETPAGSYVAISVDWETLELHDLATGEMVGEFGLGGDLSTSVWFSDDGRHLVFGTQSGRVTVLDVTEAGPGVPLADTVVSRYREPAGGVVFFTRIAGGKLATASMGGSLRVYDLADGHLAADLKRDVTGVSGISFTPDASALLYADGGNLRRLDLDPDRLAALARSRLTRGFTSEECEQYDVVHVSCPDSGADS